MKVIIISEECHGYIGIAKDFENAVDFLFTKGWIDSNLEIWDDESDCWVPLNEFLGNDWEEKIKNMSKEEFANIFYSSFSLKEVTVYGT